MIIEEQSAERIVGRKSCCTHNLCHNTSDPPGSRGSRLTPPGQGNATHVPLHVAEVCRHRSPENPANSIMVEATARATAHVVVEFHRRRPRLFRPSAHQLCLTARFRPRQLSDEKLASRSFSHFERQDNKVSSAVRTNQLRVSSHLALASWLRRPLHPAAQPFAWPTRQPAGH